MLEHPIYFTKMQLLIGGFQIIFRFDWGNFCILRKRRKIKRNFSCFNEIESTNKFVQLSDFFRVQEYNRTRIQKIYFYNQSTNFSLQGYEFEINYRRLNPLSAQNCENNIKESEAVGKSYTTRSFMG